MPIPLDTCAKIALAPLLLAQGLAVRNRALILPEAAGPRRGARGDGPDLRLLILGDSSAAGVGVETQDTALAGHLVGHVSPHRRLHWRVLAHTGATTGATLAALQAQKPEPFDVAIIALGVNDVTRAVPVRRWLAQQRRLRATLKERHGVRHILHAGLPPMGQFPALPQPLRWVMGRTAARYDRALAHDIATDPAARHIAFSQDLGPALMAPDGFHPGPAGYAVWAETLATTIVAVA